MHVFSFQFLFVIYFCDRRSDEGVDCDRLCSWAQLRAIPQRPDSRAAKPLAVRAARDPRQKPGRQGLLVLVAGPEHPRFVLDRRSRQERDLNCDCAGKEEDWLGARNFCRQRCMDSVSVETSPENEWVKQRIVEGKVSSLTVKNSFALDRGWNNKLSPSDSEKLCICVRFYCESSPQTMARKYPQIPICSLFLLLFWHIPRFSRALNFLTCVWRNFPSRIQLLRHGHRPKSLPSPHFSGASLNFITNTFKVFITFSTLFVVSSPRCLKSHHVHDNLFHIISFIDTGYLLIFIGDTSVA